MSTRLGMAGLIGVLALAGCGGGAERVVADKYFVALNQGDTQTLGSFSTVKLDKKVEKWAVNGATPETRSPAALPELVKKQQALEAEVAANNKAARGWNNDNYQALDQLNEIKKKPNASIPAKLQPVANQWKEFNDKDRALKKQLADAKEAVEHEKHAVSMAVGNVDDVTSLSGEAVEKKVDLTLTIAGKPESYVMTLRRYELSGAGGAKVQSRWVVANLQPKS